MSDEKHNNKTYPEYNLDELDGIPDEIPLDKNPGLGKSLFAASYKQQAQNKELVPDRRCLRPVCIVPFSVSPVCIRKRDWRIPIRLFCRRKKTKSLLHAYQKKKFIYWQEVTIKIPGNHFLKTKRSAEITGNHQTKIQTVTIKDIKYTILHGNANLRLNWEARPGPP